MHHHPGPTAVSHIPIYSYKIYAVYIPTHLHSAAELASPSPSTSPCWPTVHLHRGCHLPMIRCLLRPAATASSPMHSMVRASERASRYKRLAQERTNPAATRDLDAHPAWHGLVNPTARTGVAATLYILYYAIVSHRPAVAPSTFGGRR